MHKSLIAILTSLSISPVLLFSESPEIAKAECAQPKKASCTKPKKIQKKKEKEVYCGLSPRPERVEVKHIESKGVGYKTGYSSLEGFFTVPSTLDGSWVPFLDLRGHIFNDGKPAVNGGVGFRYLGDSRVWGANVYYDYRETHRTHFNQVGAGLETLGRIWDFRLNAYIPVGKKESHLFHTRFHEFKNHSIILSSKKEIAMKGANAEVGAHALREENYQLYAATGPYYFEHEGRVAWGGEGRVVFTAFDYLRLQLSGSYDKIFHGIVQGEVALTFSFGGKRTIKAYCCNDCDDRKMVVQRALQRVDRNEIIVVDKKRQKTKAVNPVTGDPYVVWFVNNTSHSLGTYESPFNALVNAQNSSNPYDIIYVFKGDGTDKNQNAGITLQAGQQLLGAGIEQQVETTLGRINIPAHDTGLPVLSNAAPMPIVTYPVVLLNAGDNVVSGLNLVDTIGGARTFSSVTYHSAGVRIDAGANYLIQNNMMSTKTNFALTTPGGAGVFVGGGSYTTIANNIILGTDTGPTVGVEIVSISSQITGTLVIKNNLLTGANASSGLGMGIANLAANSFNEDVTISILNNTINSQTNAGTSPTYGILIQAPVVSIWPAITVNMVGNNVNLPAGIAGAVAGIAVDASGPRTIIANLSNNTSQTVSPTPGFLFTGNPALLQLNFGPGNVGTRVGP